jgi:hypothetical protein
MSDDIIRENNRINNFYPQTKVVLLKDPESIIENQENQSRKS